MTVAPTVVWLNGAFGAGKTQTAFELQRRAPGCHVTDPEFLGYAIGRMVPAGTRSDFQDYPQWRSAVAATVADAAEAQAAAGRVEPVLVPMTLVNPDYFSEIVDRVRGRGVVLHHFALTASPEVLRRRLRTRQAYWVGKALGRDETWGMRQIDRCVAALATSCFAEQVDTDHRTVDEVVELVAERVGLPLVRPRLDPVRHQLHRLVVGVRHLR